MKAETPARGILKINDWGHSKMYKIECDCGNESCVHTIDIEADQFDVSVTIYSTPKTKWWSMSRWKQMLTLLFKGYLEYETTIVLNKQVALNYAETLRLAVKDVEIFEKERSVERDKNKAARKLAEENDCV
jgi:hypothetical protein